MRDNAVAFVPSDNTASHLHVSVIDITNWAQRYFQIPLLVNTFLCAIYGCPNKAVLCIKEAVCKHTSTPVCDDAQCKYFLC